MKSRVRRVSGFTLIELMVVLGVMGILAAIAMPKYADLLMKAQEGGLKGNLGSLRSALSIYYADMNGVSPACAASANSTVFADVLVPKYIPNIPIVKNGLHPPTNNVYCDGQIIPGAVHDGQGWYYDGTQPADSLFGGVWVACDHTDTKGSLWSSY